MQWPLERFSLTREKINSQWRNNSWSLPCLIYQTSLLRPWWSHPYTVLSLYSPYTLTLIWKIVIAILKWKTSIWNPWAVVVFVLWVRVPACNSEYPSLILAEYFNIFLSFVEHEKTKINRKGGCERPILKNFSLDPSRSEWEEILKDSSVVHFYHSSSSGNIKVMKKKFYGRVYPAYVPVAMNNCPASFDSERMF